MNNQHENEFLKWLGPDTRKANDRLKRIYLMLREKFGKRWFLSNADVDDLIQETMKRVVQKIAAGKAIESDSAENYIHGVAAKILLEVQKRKIKEAERDEYIDEKKHNPVYNEIPIEDKETQELQSKCLDKCIQELNVRNRRIILAFAREGYGYTKNLAKDLNFSESNIRIRKTRILAKLRLCVEDCLKNEGVL